MKHRSLWIGIIGLLIVVTLLGLLRVNFSSAQTASSSSTSSSTFPLDVVTSTPPLQLSSSSTPSSSSSTPLLSSSTSTATSSLVASSTPIVASSTVSTSTPLLIGSSTASSTPAAPLAQPTSTSPASSSPNSTQTLLSSASTTTSSSTTPQAPTNLAASAISPSRINLTWTGSTGIAGYKLYRGGSLLTTVLASSSVSAGYSDIGLSASTTYAYAVAAYDASGTLSAQSNQVSANTQTVPPPPPSPTGYATCDQTVKNVPSSYPTIQAAINATSFGDTVKIAAGTYNENLNLKSGICLEGAGVDQTIIAKSGAIGITGSGVSYAIIKNLTVANSGCEPGLCGGGGDGGGIRIVGSSNISLQSCRLTGNAAVNGGGMLVSESSITVDHCLIDGNTAHNIGGGLAVESSTVVLTNVTVANNNWSNALGNGGVGGVKFYGSSLEISNSILWGNTNQNFSGSGSSISNSDIGGWSGGTSNLNSNPSFVSNTDYHLQVGSPAMGMGAY